MSARLTKEWGAFVDWRRVTLVAVLAGIPLTAVPMVTDEFVRHVLTIGAYYVILAVSWNLLAGFTGQVSLAQHAFAAGGGDVCGLDLSRDPDLGVPRDLPHRAHRGLRVHARRSGPERAVALRQRALGRLLLHL